jgi:hypothetical protein
MATSKKKTVKRKRGRPPGSLNGPKRPGTSQVSILLTDEECDKLDRIAKENFRSRSGQLLYWLAGEE